VSSARPTFNVGGLASGLDTNSIIDQLMTIERQPKVRLQQRQAIEQARQNALRDIQTRLSNLKSAADALRDPTIWTDTQTVESSDTSRLTATRVTGAAAGAYDITITDLARAHQVTQGSALTAASADDVLHIKVGSGSTIDVSIAGGDSLDAIASKINSTTDIPVYASVVNSKLVLTSKTTGAANTISATSDGSLATDLGFATTLTAQDAQYTVNGVSKTSASNTITDAIVGLSLTLKAKTTTAVTVTVGAPGADAAKIQDKVKAFVDQYNSTIDFIRSKLTEQKVANPTTDDERAKGILNSDPGLTSLLSNLRQSVSDTVSGRPGDASLLAQVGLSTGATTGGGTTNPDAIAGKLSLDATKLSTMLSTRFADTKALFTNITGSYDSEGLTQRLDRVLDPQVAASTGILAGRIASEQSMIDSFKSDQSAMDVRLAEREKQLRAQFTALETALSQLQSQNSYLSGQFAKLSAG
jgi:flagellar hook-associated protein 2